MGEGTVPGSFAALRMTAKASNGKDEKQIPFGDDNQRDKQRKKEPE
jgi:hypothetical protein